MLVCTIGIHESVWICPLMQYHVVILASEVLTACLKEIEIRG